MKRYLALLMSVVLVVIDQVIKEVAYANLRPVDTVPLIEDVLHLTYLENTGMAFGMMRDQTWLLVWGTGLVLLILVLAVMIGKIKETFPVFVVCTIIGGGIGNLIDRVYRGYVIDYIYVKLIDFAIFNFADMCVTVGTILLLVYLIVSEFRRKKRGDARES